MSHDYHEGLAGYNAEAVLHEGCDECEQRADSGTRGLLSLDAQNFARLWDRAIQLEASNPDPTASFHVSATTNGAEIVALRTVWHMALLLERHLGVPIGDFASLEGRLA